MSLDFYEELIHVDLNVGRRRIFAQRAYPPVRELERVAVVHSEAFELASWFPIVWHREGEQLELVALRTLLPKGFGHPAGSPAAAASLPLVLKAYPIAPSDASAPNLLWIDDVVADQPTDMGAPLLNRSGAANLGTRQRIEALAQFQKGLPLTHDMTRLLDQLGLFVPWNLDHPDRPELGPFPGYFTLKVEALETAEFMPFTRRFGLEGLALIAAHTLSLFRAGILFRRAQQDYPKLKQATPSAEENTTSSSSE